MSRDRIVRRRSSASGQDGGGSMRAAILGGQFDNDGSERDARGRPARRKSASGSIQAAGPGRRRKWRSRRDARGRDDAAGRGSARSLASNGQPVFPGKRPRSARPAGHRHLRVKQTKCLQRPDTLFCLRQGKGALRTVEGPRADTQPPIGVGSPGERMTGVCIGTS